MSTTYSMDGKVCLVSGATSGIGYAAARSLAAAGADVTIIARSETKARDCCRMIRSDTGNQTIRYLLCDFSHLASIRQLSETINRDYEVIDVLLNNAGVVNQARRESRDGYEEMFAVNHLGYFLLTTLVQGKVVAAPAGRIVNTASGAHKFPKQGIRFDDLNSEKKYSSMEVYGHSKLANILFTRELARRLADTDVTVNCLHPGAVATNLGSNNGWLGRFLMTLVKPFFRSSEKGAETALYLCCDAAVDGQTGGYYYDCKRTEPNKWALDDDAAARLWTASEELIAAV